MKKYWKWISKTGIIAIAMLFALTACSGKNEPKTNETKTEQKAADGKETVETFEITDMAGRKVKIPKKIEKIANFGSVGVLNGFVQLMGEGDKIAHQMPANFTKGDKWKYQQIFSPQMKGLPVIESGKEIQIEKVLEIKPDVCFTMSKDAIKKLEENGLNVVYLSWNEPEDAKKCIHLLGEIFQKPDISKKYDDYFDEMVKRVDEKTKNLKDRKKVIYGNITELTQPHAIAEWWIKEAGGTSVTDNGRKKDGPFQYSMEDLLKWNPDVMIVSGKDQKEELLKSDKYKMLKVVETKQVFVTPTVAHVWANRTIEQPLMIFWTMHKLDPTLMPKEELKKEIHRFYQEFFNYDMKEDEINKLIEQ